MKPATIALELSRIPIWSHIVIEGSISYTTIKQLYESLDRGIASQQSVTLQCFPMTNITTHAMNCFVLV